MLKQHAWKIILLSFACWAAISTFDLAFNFCTRSSSTLTIKWYECLPARCEAHSVNSPLPPP